MIIHAGQSNGNMQIAKPPIVSLDRLIAIAINAEKIQASQQHTNIGNQNQIQSLASLPDRRPSHANRVDKKKVIENSASNAIAAKTKKRSIPTSGSVISDCCVSGG